jgi:hypothetical protein
VDNLGLCLQRGALHAPNCTPDDGLEYRVIHNEGIQRQRRVTRVPCGPGGVIHDYVPFYFGPRSPMLYQLHTGWVQGYSEGQEPIIYLVSSAERVARSGARFVFTDGHAIKAFTKWFDDLGALDQVDWPACHARYWRDSTEDMDRQRRKQAEFLVHRVCDWALIESIGVLSSRMRFKAQGIMKQFAPRMRRDVFVKPNWYY